jgi:hypothetical protein
MKNILIRLLVLPLHVGTALALCGVAGWAYAAGYYSLRNSWVVFLGGMALLWATAAVHEFGHLFAALAMRLPVQLIAIKPLQLIRVGKTFQLRFFFFPLGILGLVSVSPTDVNHLRQRMAIYVLAGPFASLLMGVSCLVLVSLVDPSFPSLLPRRQATYWLDLAALMNLCCFFVTLIPGKAGNVYTDGQKLLGYVGLCSKGERNFLLLTLKVTMVSGTRPCAWQAEVVERMLALRDGSIEDFDANCYGYYYANDCKEWHRAGEYLDLAIAHCKHAVPIFRDGILLEKAYFEAFYRQNANARAWFAQVKGEGIEKHTHLRAEAAVLFVEGNYAEAATKAQAGLAVVPESLDRGGSLAEAEWLKTLLAECQKRLNKSDQYLVPTIVNESRIEAI